MAVKEITLRSFRNYKQIKLTLSLGITIFTGKNGVGKTSILEAIYLLGLSLI